MMILTRRGLFEGIFHLEIIQDQGFAILYKLGKSFFCIVDGNKGSLRAQLQNAAMLTIIVDDVKSWYEYLTAQGVKVKSNPSKNDFVENAFYFDPGGYIVETQTFLDHNIQNVFM